MFFEFDLNGRIFLTNEITVRGVNFTYIGGREFIDDAAHNQSPLQTSETFKKERFDIYREMFMIVIDGVRINFQVTYIGFESSSNGSRVKITIYQR